MLSVDTMHMTGIDVRLFEKSADICDDDGLAILLGSAAFVSLKQVHGNRTVIVREPSRRTLSADAAITDVPGLILAVRAADCQQLIVFAPDHKICGVIHAGWRGLHAGIIPSFFAAMQRAWGVAGSDVYVIAGPSLCLHCAEFTDPVTELKGIDPRFFHGRNVDLRGIADHQLTAAGVREERIDRSSHCTKCRSGIYWSYRGGDGGKVREGYCNVMTVSMRKEK